MPRLMLDWFLISPRPSSHVGHEVPAQPGTTNDCCNDSDIEDHSVPVVVEIRAGNAVAGSAECRIIICPSDNYERDAHDDCCKFESAFNRSQSNIDQYSATRQHMPSPSPGFSSIGWNGLSYCEQLRATKKGLRKCQQCPPLKLHVWVMLVVPEPLIQL